MLKKLLMALAGIVLAFAVGSILLAAQGYDPWGSYASLASYSLLSGASLAATLNKAAPLLLAGLSAAVAFGANATNLGQPGQLLIGAMAATVTGLALDMPAIVEVPLELAAAMSAGALYAGIAAFMRRRWAMDEFITTLMLNFLADYLTLYLISVPLIDPELYSPMTRSVGASGLLPAFGGLSSSIFVASAVFAVVAVVWRSSKSGYELRMMGANARFSLAGGCRNDRNFSLAMLCSGALAGLAGAFLVVGSMQGRFLKGMGANYAWDGVMIAIVAGNGMAGTFLYAIFFAALQTGAMGMELETRVPSEFSMVFQAIIVLFVVASRESTRVIVDRAMAAARVRLAKGGSHAGDH